MQRLIGDIEARWREVLAYLSGGEFFVQLTLVAAALVVGWVMARGLQKRVKTFNQEPKPGAASEVHSWLFRSRQLLPSIMVVVALGISMPVSRDLAGSDWLITAVQGAAVIALLYELCSHFIHNPRIVTTLKSVGIPIAVLYMVGLSDDVFAYADSLTIELGNIQISVYDAFRSLIFGVMLFWLGRASSITGLRVIRTQQQLDVRTREVVAKLFQMTVFFVVFLMLLNIMGIDLTTLAVFGGALGVGLGFGLQQIASNFISGLIILVDRSITIGDYIELEDGRTGTLREMTMRSATLETFDGKDIMVPNERFITTAFTNWTHHNKKQRYALNFQVAYKTDLEKLFDVVRDTVASHPKVLSGEDLPIAERPDAEIQSFDDSGITILVEFWMEGIDDGFNRVGGDLLMMIWAALRNNGIDIPFPQREVRLLGGEETPATAPKMASSE